MDTHKKKIPADNTEEDLQRREMDNGISPDSDAAEQHPHEIRTPVGEDQRDYMAEELKEQGYGDDGLDNPNAEEPADDGRIHPHHGRKVA